MSSNISVLLLLLSCLSVHMYACNAGRVLGFFSTSTVQESVSRTRHSVDEGVEKFMVQLSEITSTTSPSTRGPASVPSEEVKDSESLYIHESVSSAGDDIIGVPTPQVDHKPESIEMKSKGIKKQARSLLRSAAKENDIEEDHNTDSEGNENEAAIDEDVGVMDYANPHRKPPIHNQKP